MDPQRRRKLSFLPARQVSEGGTVSNFLSQTAAPQPTLTNGKTVPQTKEEDIGTASQKYNSRRHRTALGGDIALFLRRLLQNAHYTVRQGTAGGASTALQFAESQFPMTKPMPADAFVQIVQQWFAKPMHIQAHMIRPAMSVYKSIDGEVDTASLRRDIRFLDKGTVHCTTVPYPLLLLSTAVPYNAYHTLRCVPYPAYHTPC
jgi:hypothetical protein